MLINNTDPRSIREAEIMMVPPISPIIMIFHEYCLSVYNEIQIKITVIGVIRWVKNVKLTPTLVPRLPTVFKPTLYQAPPDHITDHELKTLPMFGIQFHTLHVSLNIFYSYLKATYDDWFSCSNSYSPSIIKCSFSSLWYW